MATKKATDKVKRMDKYAPKTPHPWHDKLELMTKLTKKDRIVVISFKKLELSVIESELGGKPKVKESKKYLICSDIGLFRYCRCIREYEAKGYDVQTESSNMDKLLKEWKP